MYIIGAIKPLAIFAGTYDNMTYASIAFSPFNPIKLMISDSSGGRSHTTQQNNAFTNKHMKRRCSFFSGKLRAEFLPKRKYKQNQVEYEKKYPNVNQYPQKP